MTRIELECLAVPPFIDITPYVPEVDKKERIRTCVILGSFGKFHQQINAIIDTLSAGGIRVLAPKRGPITDAEGFQLLATDNLIIDDLLTRYPQISWTKDHFSAVIERIFQSTIGQAGFVYIVNPKNVRAPDGKLHPNGYAGTMVAAEIGHAIACGKPIYALEPLDECLDDNEIAWPIVWRGIAQDIKAYKPDEILSMVDSGSLDESDYFWCEGFGPCWQVTL
ncbi:MAG: hypothetical protein ACMG6E_06530 [Candidatus Roizmanbacteria bacterium]